MKRFRRPRLRIWQWLLLAPFAIAAFAVLLAIYAATTARDSFQPSVIASPSLAPCDGRSIISTG